LVEDPHELRALARAEVEPVALDQLEAALARLMAEVPAPLGPEASRPSDPESEDVLRALGYVGEDPAPQPGGAPGERLRQRHAEK
ncbi:MAG: hypothetical protein HOP15_02815, partial [Planctomycetes bacterium]|nr:hypothetical protein [Planctomycetota bacterium]